jgi:hypothetical protein
MIAKANREIAGYFGLVVKVICRMQHCALVRYRGQEFIVDTSDLVSVRQKRCAA